MRYRVISDGCYSSIRKLDADKDNAEDYETYDTLAEAKDALISELVYIRDSYRDAIAQVRALTIASLEEED